MNKNLEEDNKYELKFVKRIGKQYGKIIEYGALLGGIYEVLEKDFGVAVMFGALYLLGYNIRERIDDTNNEKRFKTLENELKQEITKK